jgi:hypothetical protein
MCATPPTRKVACALINVHMVRGEDALHSFLLLLDEAIAIISREQSVFFVALITIDVLNAHIQYL